MTDLAERGNHAASSSIATVNPEAERAVIAGLCRLPPDDAARKVLTLGISAELFAGDATREAFAAIAALLADGTPPDAATLRSALEDAALIEVETSLKENASAANLAVYVGLLKACYRERKLQTARARLVKAIQAGSPDHELQAILESIRQIGADESRPPRFLWAEDFCRNEELKDDLIDGYFPAKSTGVIFGDSETWKSFLGVDIAGHIACGLPWRDREVRQGKVVFIAGEGGSGLRTRIKAWFVRHGQAMRRNFAVSIVPLELCDPKNADLLIADIQQFIGSESVSFIVLDTLNTHFGPGDENATSDMTKFRMAMTRLSQATGATVATAHHCGLQDKGRSRGSISLRNGVDWEYKLERSGDYTTLTCKKFKDGVKPAPLSWKLVQQPLPWADKKGAPIDGAVLEPVNTSESVDRSLTTRLTLPQRTALDALNGIIRPAEAFALIADWRSAALEAGITQAEGEETDGLPGRLDG